MIDVAQTAPLVPLEQFRAHLGLNPFHFWGMASSIVPLASGCDTVREHAWQHADAVGRADIRQALVFAEGRLREYLGYPIAPQYRSAVVRYPRPAQTALSYGAPVASDGRWLSVQLPDGYVQAVGVEAITLLATATVAGGSLAYTAIHGDSLYDTFTATATVPAGTLASQIAVYVPAAERLDGAGRSERWRIRPVRVSVSGVTATIIGRAWCCVRPLLYEGYSTNDAPLDPSTTANYLQLLEVCSRVTSGSGTTTDTSQAVLQWETAPWPAWACCSISGDSSTDPAAIATAVARTGIRDAVAGIVTPGEAAYDSTSGTWASVGWDGCRQPDQVTVRYLAGVPLTEDYQIDPLWTQAAIEYAAAELQRPICGCDTANARLYWLQTDLARTGGNAGDQYGAVSAQDLDNPYGTRRGHVRAWRAVRNLRQLRGYLP